MLLSLTQPSWGLLNCPRRQSTLYTRLARGTQGSGLFSQILPEVLGHSALPFLLMKRSFLHCRSGIRPPFSVLAQCVCRWEGLGSAGSCFFLPTVPKQKTTTHQAAPCVLGRGVTDVCPSCTLLCVLPGECQFVLVYSCHNPVRQARTCEASLVRSAGWGHPPRAAIPTHTCSLWSMCF